MTDEKPKHKPQQKHTLNEVLKSLQDLIRNDLGGTQAVAKTVRQAPKAGTPHAARTTSFAAATPPTGSEADSFNQALAKLDEIIHEKIIEPAARTRQAPPEPQVPEEDLQIDWEDTAEPQAPDPGEVRFDLAGDVKLEDIHFETAELAAPDIAAGDDEAVELEAFQPAAEESAAPAAENIDINAFDAAEADAVEDIELKPLDFADNPPDETIEPAQESLEPKATDNQGTFSFTEPAFESEPALPNRDGLAAETAEEPPPSTLEDGKTEPTVSFDAAELQPRESSEPEGSAAGKGPATFTVEYRPEPAPAAAASKAEAKREPESAAAAPTGTAQKSAPGAENIRTEREHEIPVLKEVAELDGSRSASPPLPAARQAREIAIRVIARLNIERRKAGEAPLDIKTIEQLQQYLAEALTKRALNKPT